MKTEIEINGYSSCGWGGDVDVSADTPKELYDKLKKGEFDGDIWDAIGNAEWDDSVASSADTCDVNDFETLSESNIMSKVINAVKKSGETHLLPIKAAVIIPDTDKSIQYKVIESKSGIRYLEELEFFDYELNTTRNVNPNDMKGYASRFTPKALGEQWNHFRNQPMFNIGDIIEIDAGTETYSKLSEDERNTLGSLWFSAKDSSYYINKPDGIEILYRYYKDDTGDIILLTEEKADSFNLPFHQEEWVRQGFVYEPAKKDNSGVLYYTQSAEDGIFEAIRLDYK